MPSSKASSNSNKTAHVMNLLRKNNPAPAAPAEPISEKPVSDAVLSSPEPVKEAGTPSVTPAVPAAPQPAPQAPPIIAALHADTEISLQIRDALSDTLVEEQVVSNPQQSNLDQLDSEQSAPSSDSKLSDNQTAEPAVSTSPNEPADEKIDVLNESPSETVQKPEEHNSAPVKDDTSLINIIYEITEQNVDKYINMFDICPCSRCRKDVMALALNDIPPKYVVLSPIDQVARADMYNRRYISEVTAQLLRACIQVRDHPRHG